MTAAPQASSFDSEVWPLELCYHRGRRQLELRYDDGAVFFLSAELLRVSTPSAQDRGHGEERPAVSGKQEVQIKEMEPVGNYAVRLHFDDGHNSGFYTWRFLYQLGRNGEDYWQSYCQALHAQGLSRSET